MKAEHVFMIFMVLVNLYLILPRLCGRKEYNAVQGASANNIDETAWVNLHAILHELYNSGTLTIPGNLKIVGDLDIGGNVVSDLRANNLRVNNMFRLAGETADGDGNKWIRVHNDLHVGWGKKINTNNLEVYNIKFPPNVTPGDGKYWIRFKDHVHIGWTKHLNVSGHTELEKGLKLPGIKNQAADSALKPSDEATYGWVYDDNNRTLKVGN